jgi:hypothetical protein
VKRRGRVEHRIEAHVRQAIREHSDLHATRFDFAPSDNRKTLLLQQKSNGKYILEDILLNLSERETITTKSAEMRSLLKLQQRSRGTILVESAG